MSFKIPRIPKPPPPPTPPTPPTPVTPSRPGGNRRPTTQPVEEPSNSFGKTLEGLLGNKYASTKVSEEELYAALIMHQLKQKFGNEYINDFKTTFKLNTFDKLPNESKEASAERAANVAMKFFVESTLLSSAEAKEIKDTAFQLAQLDSRTDKLWDKFGGDPQNTIAVTSFAKGQKLIQERLDALQSSSAKSMRARAKLKKISAMG